MYVDVYVISVICNFVGALAAIYTVFVVSPGPANILKCSDSLQTVITVGDGFICKMCRKLVSNYFTWNAK